MNRKTRLILFSAIVVVLLMIAAYFTWPRQKIMGDTNVHVKTPAADAAKFKADYSGVADDNRFVVSTSDEILAKFDSGDGLIFLGFKQCPWCQALAPIVDEAAKKEGLDKIYYLDISDARKNNDETYQKIIAKLKGYLRKDEQGNPRVYVPDVTAVRNGKVVGHFLQETTAGGEKVTANTYWTDERRARGVEQLREMIRKIRD